MSSERRYQSRTGYSTSALTAGAFSGRTLWTMSTASAEISPLMLISEGLGTSSCFECCRSLMQTDQTHVRTHHRGGFDTVSYNPLGQRRSTKGFMSKRVIRVGDPISHGGKVVACSAPHFTVDGIAVALVGTPCTCPSQTAHRSINVTDPTGEPNVIEDHYSRRQNRSWRHSY
jgi:uncharacterized Zn-binding protein involved in type VI secretion